MAGRGYKNGNRNHASSSGDEGLGCLLGAFELILALIVFLFCTGNKTCRVIAWSLLGLFVLLWIMAEAGFTADEAITLLGAVVKILVVVGVIGGFVYVIVKSRKN